MAAGRDSGRSPDLRGMQGSGPRRLLVVLEGELSERYSPAQPAEGSWVAAISLMLFTSHPGSGSSEVPEVGSAPADAKRLGRICLSRVLGQSAWVGFLSRTVVASERPGFYPLILGRLLHAREEGVASELGFCLQETLEGLTLLSKLPRKWPVPSRATSSRWKWRPRER